jgi:flagellar FliL protein
MAAQTANQEANADSSKAGNPLLGKLAIAGFMGGVVALECLIAYFVFPSTEEVAALAQQNLEKKLPATLAADAPGDGQEDSENVMEVDLGQYSITVPQPNSTTSLRVDFHLVGTVLDTDESEATSLYDRNVHRFRDQVLVEIRNSEPADLADPGLALIKRRILEKSNALLGKPVLRSVVFSEFSCFEQ